ncbi:heavy metal-translocating P-type ATPase, Cd/Co/Hg/Pb/Zn-transporting [Marinitoga piezophila KA3]|uniref:P-type Zn(2+) transporter n=1 Tax=Marinitoga piezophila (strain DSM 14283 / JCM 11233 / KA3) TaxID=443254 RepID=H2J5M8_MARPK|nr:heavy metal translocating P-type ATPase [Marinitoga piezophila]AEX85014.1 heavy metal-translocating P-type ATPase, Cd/Co/Hg/Pb/Zn-transporting [Marinitoga piezophila KA3]
MKKKELVLDGLNCASCAAKIEENVKNLENVEGVELNFITKTLSVNVDDEDKIEEIKKLVKNIEPEVLVYEKNNKNEKNNENGHNHGDEEFNRKFEIIRLISALGIFLTALFVKEPVWLQISLYIIAYLISGGKVLIRSFKNIIRGNFFDENFLMSVATIGAFSIGEFPEAVGVMVFYEIGELLQDIAVDNSKKSIKALLDIRPDYANLLKNGKEIKVSPEEVKKGDLIIVKPGEKIPLDGFIVKGNSMVDTSALTGESVPRTIKENDEVMSGFINLNGVITIKVDKEYAESTISKILDMVENAAAKKAQTEKLITKFAKYYTPVVVFLAIALATLPPLITGASFNEWLYRALIFLVISCPCGLVVSIPLGYFAGVGALSKRGVLVKGGNYLERLKNLDIIIFDKTGTLTEGVFEVVDIKGFNNFKEKEILEIAAYAEKHSNHPIAESIKRKFGKNITKDNIEDYEEISGYGIKAKINKKEILVGNKKLMSMYGIKTPEIKYNGTIVFVAIEGKFAGYIEISDRIKPGVAEVIKNLKNLGIKKTVMLTGDNKKVAESVAKELEIDEYYAELLPGDKIKLFEKFINGVSTAFVGDGINDAPVLTRADVGIAMGGLGSDAAIEAADVVIMDDDISKLIDSIMISRKTLKITWQNIILVLGIKVLFLTLGALGKTDMWGAVFADVGVTLMAVFNTLRILKK